MFTANRRLVEAKEKSVDALVRSAAAKRQIADGLRKMMRSGDAPAEPPSPPKTGKNELPRK